MNASDANAKQANGASFKANKPGPADLSEKIRRAGPEDLEALLALEQAAFSSEAFSRRQLRYLLKRSKGAFFVLEEAGQLAAYVTVLLRAGQNWCRVYSLAVAAAWRGRGLAAALLDAVEDFARQRNLKTIFLEVSTENTAAQALYAKRGFKVRFSKAGYYHNGSAALFMGYELPPA